MNIGSKRLLNKILRVVAVGLLAALAIVVPVERRAAQASTAQAAACSAGHVVPIVTYAYSNGWLLCDDGDEYQGSEQVYKETTVGSGTFVFVKGAGGWYEPQDLEEFANVDAADATSLVAQIAYNLNLRVSSLPGWRCSTCGNF